MTDSLNNLNNMYVYINCLIHIRNLDRKYTDFRFRHKNICSKADVLNCLIVLVMRCYNTHIGVLPVAAIFHQTF